VLGFNNNNNNVTQTYILP